MAYASSKGTHGGDVWHGRQASGWPVYSPYTSTTQIQFLKRSVTTVNIHSLLKAITEREHEFILQPTPNGSPLGTMPMAATTSPRTAISTGGCSSITADLYRISNRK